MKRGALVADAVLLFITGIWGLTFVIVKDALADADPFTFLALRFTLGSLAVAAVSVRHLRDVRVWRSGAILGALLFVGYAFQTVGLTMTTPSRSAFITGLIVIFIPFTQWALTREPIGWSALLGTVVATVGLALLTKFDGGGLPLGDLLSLGCAVAYSVQIVLTGRFANGVNPVALVAVELGVTAVLSWLALPFVEVRLNPTAGLWSGVLITGLIASAFAISAQTWAQARTSAIHAGLIFTLEPAVAAVFSTLMGRERLTLREWAGGLLILSGVVVAELWGRREPAPASAAER